MLFLHGFPEFWYAWKNQLLEFGRDHLAVAPDMRGYNLSAKPTGLDAYRVRALVEDVRALADHFSPQRQFVLVAHDWGGAIAWAFAIRHPELLERLVIINAPHPGIFAKLLADNAEQQKASRYMTWFRRPDAEARLSADGYARLVNTVMGDGLKSGVFDEVDKAAYLQAWSQPGALTGGLNYYRANQWVAPGSASVELDAAKLTVKVPTLVIWGEGDTALTLNNLDGLDQYVPQLTIRRIPGASHWVIHEQPDVVSGYIRDFLKPD
jgi:pimeloyl-ACP methyl ester carboxylesterase